MGNQILKLNPHLEDQYLGRLRILRIILEYEKAIEQINSEISECSLETFSLSMNKTPIIMT